MIVEFLRIIAILLLIIIILMDDFPFYSKLRDQSLQFILALLTLVIIYYDATLGFIVALILMLMYYEIYSKIIKKYKEDDEILKDKTGHGTQAKTPYTMLDDMNTLNNNYDQYLETDPNCDPIELKYVSEEHLLSAQNNIVDEKAYVQEIKGMACNGENESSVYAAQGLDSDSVNYLGYEKSNYLYAPL